MKKIVTIVGARPQFIKAAVVSRKLREIPQKITELLVHTGQHFDENMSDIFFDELNISTPDFHLGIGGGTHGQNTGRMIEKIEEVLMKENPDIVLVYGDTDSTLAASIASSKLTIPIAHVEAGLRSGNRQMPEEINRILTDHASDYLFTPTTTATTNLRNEGIDEDYIWQVGDVMYDMVLYYTNKSDKESLILDRLRLHPREYVLLTIHRKENTNDIHRLENIFNGLRDISFEIVLPLHPRTAKYLNKYELSLDRLNIVDPVSYIDMLMLEKKCCFYSNG